MLNNPGKSQRNWLSEINSINEVQPIMSSSYCSRFRVVGVAGAGDRETRRMCGVADERVHYTQEKWTVNAVSLLLSGHTRSKLGNAALLLMCCCVISSFREVLARKRRMQTFGLATAPFTWVIIRELWRYFAVDVCV